MLYNPSFSRLRPRNVTARDRTVLALLLAHVRDPFLAVDRALVIEALEGTTLPAPFLYSQGNLRELTCSWSKLSPMEMDQREFHACMRFALAILLAHVTGVRSTGFYIFDAPSPWPADRHVLLCSSAFPHDVVTVCRRLRTAGVPFDLRLECSFGSTTSSAKRVTRAINKLVGSGGRSILLRAPIATHYWMDSPLATLPWRGRFACTQLAAAAYGHPLGAPTFDELALWLKSPDAEVRELAFRILGRLPSRDRSHG